MARVIGVLLIMAGLVALLYGGFGLANGSQAVAIGPPHVGLVDSQQWPIPPLAGAMALGAGVIFFLLSIPRARARHY